MSRTFSGDAERRHIVELDSLRGLAALSVMLHHWRFLWKDTPQPYFLKAAPKSPLLKPFFAGHSAVIMFFVLSGFVLSLPREQGKHVAYSDFLIKRVCRIYLPYLFALAIAVACCFWLHGLAYYGPWFEATWSAPPDLRSILEHVLFLGHYDQARYNTAFWSLVQEMRISIIFPCICALVFCRRITVGILTIAALLATSFLLEHRSHLAQTWIETIAYTGIFALGALLCRYRHNLKAALPMRRITYWLIFLAMVGLYSYAPSVLYLVHHTEAATDILCAIGAAGIILYAMTTPSFGTLLKSAPLATLGKISYSLYLLHGTVLFVFAYAFAGRISPFLWVIPYIATTIGLALLMYQYVEKPAIGLGKAIVAPSKVNQDRQPAQAALRPTELDGL